MTDPKRELEQKRLELESAQKTLNKLRERAVGIPLSERSSVVGSDLEAQEKLVEEIRREIVRLEQQVSEEQAILSEREKVFSRLRFTNRRDELKRLSDPTAIPTYLVIDAPGEYGKTFLLTALIDLYQTGPSRWKCLRHEVSTSDKPQSLLKSLYRQVSGNGRDLEEGLSDDEGINRLAIKIIEYASATSDKSWGTTLIFDNLERLKQPYRPMASETATWLLGTFIPGLLDQLERSGILHKHHVKFIFSGRYIADMVKSEAGHLPIAVETLGPFNWHAVQGAVEWELRESGLSPKEPDIAHHIAQLTYHTGGHPGYLSHLLTEVANSRFTLDPAEFYKTKIGSFYRKHISDTVEQIREAVREAGGSHGQQLVNAIDTLALFRRFDAAIIQDLIQRGELEWTLLPWDLITMMGPLHMLTSDRGYYQDAIARKLLVIRLRHEETKRFKHLCKVASDLYEKRLDSQRRQKEPVLLFTEWLYQEAQLAAVDQEKREELRSLLHSREIENQVRKVISNLDEFEDPVERLDSLLREVVSDDELKFMINFALVVERFDIDFDPMSALIDTIENVIQESESKAGLA